MAVILNYLLFAFFIASALLLLVAFIAMTISIVRGGHHVPNESRVNSSSKELHSLLEKNNQQLNRQTAAIEYDRYNQTNKDLGVRDD